jgi:hypothetical protein
MSTRFHQTLSTLTRARLGFDLAQEQQGSDRWLAARLGVITASRASDLIAVGRGGKGVGAARDTYLYELIGEVATGQQKDMGKFRQTEFGKEHEDTAREIFAFDMGLPVMTIPFIYGDHTMRYGCSPDGLVDEHSGLELKCPYTTDVFLKFLLKGEIKPEYETQCQFSMFVTGLPYWHFGNHDPRMKVKSFHAVTIERDETLMKTFEDAVGQMVFDMDSGLARLGLRFGDQWPAPLQEAA